MKISPALRIIGKYPASLDGRSLGVLVTDGADGKTIKALKKGAEAQGASVKIIAPKIGGVTLKDGSKLKADGQLAGTPSVLFDAVALVLSEEGCAELLNDGAAIDFVKQAFGHLKAIGVSPSAEPLLNKAAITPDEAVLDLTSQLERFFDQAATRLWAREPTVRMLA